MTKVCAYPDCKSGHACERKKNILLNKPNKSLFKFPNKSLPLRKKWEEVIGRAAKDSDFLCELHFREEDIIRNYQTILPGGIKHIMSRGKISLKTNAIPFAHTSIIPIYSSPPTPNVVVDEITLNDTAEFHSTNIFNIFQNSSTCEILNERDVKSLFNDRQSYTSSSEKRKCRVVFTDENGITNNISPVIEKPCTHESTHENVIISSKILKERDVNLTPMRQTHESNTRKTFLEIASTDENPIGNVLCPTIKKQCIHPSSDINDNFSKEIPIIDQNVSWTSRISQESETSNIFTIKKMYKQLEAITLPDGWSKVLLNNGLMVGYWGSSVGPPKKQFYIHKDGSVEVFINGHSTSVPGLKPGTTVSNILKNIELFQNLLLCDGTGLKDGFSDLCVRYVQPKQIHVKYGSVRCIFCTKFRKRIVSKEQNALKRAHKQKIRNENNQKVIKNIKVKNQRLEKKLTKLTTKLAKKRKNCARVRQEIIDEEMSKLPPTQREVFKVCFDAAKVSDRGRRYTQQWIYECLLMRIKSKKLYDHLRSHKILSLPHESTLNKYLKCMGSAYGFNLATFNLLKKQSEQKNPAERRGALLIDEMKLAENLRFDRDSCQFHGFVNLGDHTPHDQKHELGDHALVFMFQPFRGKWVQALACFLSKGCAKSSVLHCLILECLMLLEQSGFQCDVITTDGATWNRSTWKRFGIEGENVFCEHPYDIKRKLWFCSDFPHLIKNLRNFIIKSSETWTPDGVIKMSHWQAILDCENNPYGLQVAHKLTANHLKPLYYQKMNVPLAFELFSDRVAAAMQIFRKFNSNLKDAEPTIKFIKRIGKLIKAMMSRKPSDALTPNSQSYQVIKNFLNYLKEWEKEAKNHNYNFLSDSTNHGLKVTLSATLEILQFLTYENNYKYLMTARLNQDALERFFGLARGVCGSNDHPDSILFGQMFRLMSTYSLIKPSKGSNVTGDEMLNSLINFKDLSQDHSGRQEFQEVMDSIIEMGKSPENHIHNQVTSNKKPEQSETEEVQRSLMGYMAGYIVRKSHRWTKCIDCIQSIQSTNPDHANHELISLLSRGDLIYPSERLIELIEEMERTVLKTVNSAGINCDTIFQISYALEELSLPLIGCSEHMESLTKSVASFYIIIRAEFLAKRVNKLKSVSRLKTRQNRKNAKL